MDERLTNYTEYDKLVLYVKDTKTKTIIDAYKRLGFELVTSVCNHKYRNIMDLTFVRPHNICNKDKLQLLQVNMEAELNALEKNERNKLSNTIPFGISIAILGLGLIVWSIIQLFNWGIVIDKILGLSCMFLGLTFFCVLYFVLPKIYKKDILRYEYYNKKYNENLNNIYKQIKNYCNF